MAAPLRWLTWIGETSDYWWPVGPILLALLAIAWVRSGRVAQFNASAWNGLRLIPLDEVASGRLRDGQFLRAARALARASGDLSVGPDPGVRSDRQRSIEAWRGSSWPRRSSEASQPGRP